jgi:hypothetical protein
MPTMVTFQAGRIAVLALLAALAAACSREQQDWRSAEGADTSEAWARFIEQHPDSELAPEARTRIAQLAEARDWQHATSIATVEAYREFLARYPHGRRSEDARIRIEAFSLGSAPRIEPQTPAEAAASSGARGVSALQIATGTAPPVTAPATADNSAASAAQRALAVPGEAAQPASFDRDAARAPAAAANTADVPVAVPVAAAAYAPLGPAAAGTAPGGAALSAAAAPVGYGVQLGAFGSEASADREWQRLQGRFGAQLGGLSPKIIPASSTSGPLYRLQIAAAGEAQARAICDSLKEQSQPCVPVLPR